MMTDRCVAARSQAWQEADRLSARPASRGRRLAGLVGAVLLLPLLLALPGAGALAQTRVELRPSGNLAWSEQWLDAGAPGLAGTTGATLPDKAAAKAAAAAELAATVRTIRPSSAGTERNTAAAPAVTAERPAGPALISRLRAVLAGEAAGGGTTGAATTQRLIRADGRSEPLSVVVPTATVDLAQLTRSMRANVTDPAGLRVYLSDMGTPSQIEAADLTPKLASQIRQVQTRTAQAKGFLASNRSVLRLDNPDEEMLVKAETVDSHGITRVRFQQTYRGLPVFAQEASIYIERDGRLARMSGRYRPTPVLSSVDPTLTAADAQAAANREAGAELDVHRSELVVLPDADSNTMTLAWHVEAYASRTQGWHFFVDATTGAILLQYSAVAHADGKVNASGKNLAGSTVNFLAWLQGTNYFMIDVTQPGTGAGVLNPNVGNLRGYNYCAAEPCNSYAALKATQPGGPWDAAGVSAFDGIAQTLTYFKTTHGRNGIDGNSGTVQFVVNQIDGGEGEQCNAFWNDAARMMFFGKGDNTNCTNLAASINVIGHELAHGVTASTADLVYQGQSGALNESFSDVFGAMVDRADWLIGKSLFIGQAYLRNMADPHLGMPSCSSSVSFAQPRHMNEYFTHPDPKTDNGGVHCNSGIPNRAAYLVAEGLTAEGLGASIGRAQAEQIYYYALTQLMHANDQFIDARRNLIKAAQVKFGAGSAQETAVTKAFDAVGIVEPQGGGTTPGTGSQLIPTDGDPINAPSLLLYRRASDGKLMAESNGSVFGPITIEAAAASRPAVFWGTATNSALIFYINDKTKSLRVVATATGKDELVSDGDFYGFALSPSGQFVALTLNTQRELFILDLDAQQALPYTILMPTADGKPEDVGASAYSPSFDYLSQNLVFDFAIPKDQPDGTKVDQFSFGTLNILTGEFDTVAIGQPANIHLANPTFATNNNYVIAFDLVDTDNGANTAVRTLNRNTKAVARTGSLDLSGEQRATFGRPAFNRDDTGLFVQTRSKENGNDCLPCLIASVAITKGSDGAWTPATQLFQASSSPAGFPTLFIQGARDSVTQGSWTLAPATIAFPTIALNATSVQNVTLTNTGNVDITLLSIVSDSVDFRTSATNRLLPRGKSITVPVTFAPLLPGARTGNLRVTTDNWGTKTVALSGTATGSPPGAREPVANVVLPARGDCASDFYVAEATLAPGARSGYWGMEVALSKGLRELRGGFNLGGMFDGGGRNAGFGAFSLTSPQNVTFTVNAQPLSGPINLSIDLLKDNQTRVGGVAGTPTVATPLTFAANLAPGFYVVQINSTATSGSGTFQLALFTPGAFAGGVVVGGYLTRNDAGNSLTGFGAFCVPESQSVRVSLFDQSLYGANATGDLVLTLKDAQRRVLGTFK